MNPTQINKEIRNNPKLHGLCEIPDCWKQATHKRRQHYSNAASSFCRRHYDNDKDLHRMGGFLGEPQRPLNNRSKFECILCGHVMLSRLEEPTRCGSCEVNNTKNAMVLRKV